MSYTLEERVSDLEGEAFRQGRQLAHVNDSVRKLSDEVGHVNGKLDDR